MTGRKNKIRPPRWSGTASTHGTGYKPILTHQGGKGKKNMNIERRMEKVMERVCAEQGDLYERNI